MEKIPLPNGLYTVIDKEDYELVAKYKWSVTKLGHRRTRYARTNIKDECGKYTTERMHRIIMGVEGKAEIIVDHINGDGLDNRKANLRLANAGQNASNVSLRRDNTSGYKGVSFRKDRGTWLTEIRKNYKNVYRSTSQCRHLAGLKYNDNVIRFHGEFVWKNEIKECQCDECITYKRARNTS